MIRLLAYLSASLPVMAFGHLPGSVGGRFLTGFLHPIVGVDHLIAMVAVSLWGEAFLGERVLWILPIVFPSIMAVGAAIGISGLEIPLVESVIALSGFILGTLIMFRVRVPLKIAILLVGGFCYFSWLRAWTRDAKSGQCGYLWSWLCGRNGSVALGRNCRRVCN